MALHNLQHMDAIDMDDPVTKYCVSVVTRNVARYGLENLVSSWNSHTISGVGIPNVLFTDTWQRFPVPANILPTAQEAAMDYCNHGGRLANFGTFGEDPLAGNIRVSHQRSALFNNDYPDLSLLMSHVGMKYYSTFQNAVLRYIEITNQLAAIN